MTTVAHVQLLDAAGGILHNLDVRDGISTEGLIGNTAARAAWLTVRMEDIPAPEFGSPGALAEYRRNARRDLALDQMRRGLDACGVWDARVPRCDIPSPEGGRCTLAAHHARAYDLGADDSTKLHERITDTTRPREVAEVWRDEESPSQGTKFLTRGHFTAWLVDDTSCLDQPNCDLTVLEDTLIGQDPEDPHAWSCAGGEHLFYAVTSVPAADADIDLACREAVTLLSSAGWNPIGNWEATGNAYTVTVERTI